MWFQNEKVKYFKHKLMGAQKMIWDFEFKKEKTLMIREEVRREYDGVRAKVSILEERMKSFPALDPEKNGEDKKEKWSDEQRGVDDEKIRLLQTKERFEAQMKQMDLDVHGSKPTNEYPDGVDGIDQQLESLRELQGMLKEYIKKI